MITEFTHAGGQRFEWPVVSGKGLAQQPVEPVLVPSLVVGKRAQVEIELFRAIGLRRDGLEQGLRI